MAEFVCSSDKGQLNWMITIPGMSTELFSFGNFFRDPYEIYGPDSSVIRANLTFINSTFITSTMTLYRAIYLNSTILECSGQTLKYYIPSIGMYMNIIYLITLTTLITIRIILSSQMHKSLNVLVFSTP